MGERGPTLQDVLDAVSELRGELGEVRIGLGAVRGRIDRIDGAVAEQGRRLDGLTDEMRELRTDLPVQVVAGVLVGFERSAYVTDLRALQVEVAELKADVATLKRASGE